MNFKNWMASLAAVLLAATHGAAWADGELTPEGLIARYPAGSIQSEEVADRALHEVDQLRGDVEQKYAEEQHVCYSKFFATSCLDAAKEKRRVALAQIRGVEVDANSYIRANRVVERDRQLAEKRARDAANPPKPLTEVAPKPANDQGAPRDPNELARRQAEHDASLSAQQREEAARAPERAEKVAAYNKKVADAEARQRDVAQKKAEKQKQAEEKAAKSQAAASKTDASKSQAPAAASGAGASTPASGKP